MQLPVLTVFWELNLFKITVSTRSWAIAHPQCSKVTHPWKFRSKVIVSGLPQSARFTCRDLPSFLIHFHSFFSSLLSSYVSTTKKHNSSLCSWYILGNCKIFHWSEYQFFSFSLRPCLWIPKLLYNQSM